VTTTTNIPGPKPESTPKSDPEARWPSGLALLAAAALYFSLPPFLRIGPGWLLPAMVVLLLVPTVVARRSKRFVLNQILGYLVSGVVTVELIISLALLVRALPGNQLAPKVLLSSAVALWVTNILVFATWYWRLDAGGPNERDRRLAHVKGDFLFPQMTIDTPKGRGWSPGFVDYLFLAFNTSTAFSPTDVPILSRGAKLMTMLQATISLATVALLAGRAVNIL
jgi:hypothetical protein